jgi:hypothetical protein
MIKSSESKIKININLIYNKNFLDVNVFIKIRKLFLVMLQTTDNRFIIMRSIFEIVKKS